MKIGILGGAFNPPHLGHLVIAQEVREYLSLEKIFFIPTNISPHKKNNEIGAEIRLDMVKLAISNYEYFEVKDCEIKRGGISYTVDTVKSLKKDYPGDDFYLIVGSDLADRFYDWKNFAELKKLVKIVIALRKDYPLKDKEDFILVNITQIDISSSQIRQLVKKGHSIRHLVKDSVADYIEKHRLYKRSKDD